mmetsp:Transcript_30158/g.77993  ORF Transcript_30158/g.77993 Transcript_30158/m.77993 type:complete len:434 (+) Transcript_30158:1315-2616(+)
MVSLKSCATSAAMSIVATSSFFANVPTPRPALPTRPQRPLARCSTCPSSALTPFSNSVSPPSRRASTSCRMRSSSVSSGASAGGALPLGSSSPPSALSSSSSSYSDCPSSSESTLMAAWKLSLSSITSLATPALTSRSAPDTAPQPQPQRTMRGDSGAGSSVGATSRLISSSSCPGGAPGSSVIAGGGEAMWPDSPCPLPGAGDGATTTDSTVAMTSSLPFSWSALPIPVPRVGCDTPWSCSISLTSSVTAASCCAVGESEPAGPPTLVALLPRSEGGLPRPPSLSEMTSSGELSTVAQSSISSGVSSVSSSSCPTIPDRAPVERAREVAERPSWPLYLGQGSGKVLTSGRAGLSAEEARRGLSGIPGWRARASTAATRPATVTIGYRSWYGSKHSGGDATGRQVPLRVPGNSSVSLCGRARSWERLVLGYRQ